MCRLYILLQMPIEGLYSLLVAFYDACENVLHKYGPVDQSGMFDRFSPAKNPEIFSNAS